MKSDRKLHIARGLYYGSYKSPRVLVWAIGVIILIVMMATAFLGYKYSQKWSNFNSKNKKISSFNTPAAADKNKKYKNIYLIQKRYYSNYSNRSLPLSLSNENEVGEGWGNNSSNLNKIKNESTTNSLSILSNFIKEKKLTPVYFYEDLHLDETRKKILTETKGLSGIYLILNKVTFDYYIGSASTDRFFARFSNHLIYFRGSKVVKNAVRKYKLSNFAFLILELFLDNDGIVTKENNKQLLNIEDFYLKSLLPNYNILTEAGSSFGYKHTEITRLKMTQNYSQERREKIGNLNKNKKLSPETIEKIRKAALSRTKPLYTEEALKNMKKSSKAIIVYNLDKTVYGEFLSIVEAAKSLKCGEKTIRRALKGETKFLKRK